MSTKKSAADDKKATTVVANDPDDLKGTLKHIGGSKSDHWNGVLANQTIQTLWLKHSDKETSDHQLSATVAGLVGIGPKDELEGMIAAQLLAAHNAAMECYRRAMIGEQSFEGRRENLSQANKLSRTYAVLLDALKHGGGDLCTGRRNAEREPGAVNSASRQQCRTGRCRMHGGMSPGAPKGNENALKHGRYTAEAIERRRKISGLIGAMKALAKASE